VIPYRHQEALMRARFFLPVLIASLVSCTDAPTSAPSPLPGGDAVANADAVKLREANAAVYWSEVIRNMVAANRSTAAFAVRAYAIVSVAQYNAAISAEHHKVKKTQPSVRAAIGAASAVTLSYLYPTQASALEHILAAFLAAPASPGENHTDRAAGDAIGRAVAQQIVTRAQGDRFFAPGTLPVPVGPGLWFSDAPPVGALWGQAKTFLVLSSSQFRPPAPPAFGSAEFNAALAEVRHISDTRTAQQDSIAKFWDGPLGTPAPAGYWNEAAARLAVRYRLRDREAAHVFALMHMVGYDGLVSSHEAKYFYWLLRPTMADPAITLSIPLPNFPSYPSNHAVISGGMARVLGGMFPAEKARLDALAEEAALSRVLGGIHYRFDADAGLVLGRAIAVWALAHDVNGHEPFVLP
jgi:hypothetical protein